ncbi:MAG: hypothetical protein RJA22_489 [Verrucomicrobiota bacterium]
MRALLAALFGVLAARADDLDDARARYLEGKYAECIRMAENAIAADDASDEWPLLLARAFLATGRYTNAHSVISTNLDRHPWSVKLRLLGHEVCRRNGQAEEATNLVRRIDDLAGARMWAYQDAPNLTAIGRTALLLGVDAKRVLEFFYDRARQRDPEARDPRLASGELALEKGDFQLAAKTFGEGLKKFPGDPDFHHGLARAFAPSDRAKMLEHVGATLTANTNHAPSYLLLADHLIDGEEYAEADRMLDRALQVNPWLPEAWAYRAVLAHLRNDPAAEQRARRSALKYWADNPAVDHLLGRKLSQKYRFAEGAACQRQALAFDAGHLPAKAQLASDLLRLGQEEEGWRLAGEVQAADGYDVQAFNLSNLRDHMAKFATLTNTHFIVRMATNEAALYGAEVLALLERARTTLCAKYGLELQAPTIVEIFPDPKDFGVRTFGMPGNPGYLGVCFGSVITANSPASQAGRPANWQAVLWHEFCHVVTLQLTRNKMPRWLSEGISVHEELAENPAWGQVMNPRYREMILGDDFVPLGELSAAFLAPKSDLHLQFAYFESALAVDFLVGRFGLDPLRRILRDLGQGAEINAAMTRHTAPLDTLEKEFARFARQKAEQLAPGLDFTPPARGGGPDVADPIPAESRNYYTLTREAQRLLEARDYAAARRPLEKLLRHYPGDLGPNNAHVLLAQVHRGLGETNEERAVLARLAEREADDLETFQRLMDLEAAASNWAAVAVNARRYLAVNPLLSQPYRQLARAAEALGQPDEAIAACRHLLRLDPPDPAGTHFQLARLLQARRDPDARRHLLMALEEAPRFREAHRLLLQLPAPAAPAPPGVPAAEPPRRAP